MFKELQSLMDTESPVAWVLGTILAIYLAIKIGKDVTAWVKNIQDKRKKELTDDLTYCHVQDTRITKLEQAFIMMQDLIKEIKTKLDKVLGI